MNILDDITSGEGQPIDLAEVAATLGSPTLAPASTLKNRASVVAALEGDASKANSTYRGIIAEGEQGGTSTFDSSVKKYSESEEIRDNKTMMSILSDGLVSFEDKRAALNRMKKQRAERDSRKELIAKTIAEGSKGENADEEKARVVTAASMIDRIYEESAKQQALVNAHGANLSNEMPRVTVDALETIFAPFSSSIFSLKMEKELAEKAGKPFSFWDGVKAFTLSGTSKLQARERLARMSPEDQTKYYDTLISVISSNSNIIFPTDNQFNKFVKSTELLEKEGYGKGEAFVDNISFLLDTLGIGFAAKQLLRSSKTADAAVSQAGPQLRPGHWDRTRDALTPTSKLAPPEQVRPATKQISERIDSAVGAISELQKANKAPDSESSIRDAIKRIEINSVVRKENPASVAGAFTQTNPSKARAAHAAVVNGGEEAAEALHGTSKQDAIVSNVIPQARTESGKVAVKVGDIDRHLREMNPEVQGFVRELVRTSDPAIHFTLEELATARAQVVRDFSSVTDIVPVDAMGGFKITDTDGAFVDISSVYGTRNGAWSSAQDAIDQTVLALRKEGVTLSDITLLKRDGTDYVPTSLSDELGKEGSYLAELHMERELVASDIVDKGGKMTPLNVKRNTLDRISQLVSNNTGSASRWLFDPASMLHPTITGSASVATDLSSRFERVLYDISARFSDDYNKLIPERKLAVDKYLRDANFNRIKFDRTNLASLGFSPSEIDTISKWKDYWDVMWTLENRDAGRTLNMQGYGIFKNANDTLFAKAISKNQNIPNMYDPAAGAIVGMDKAAMDALYASGGTIASLRRPSEFGGKTTSHMIVRNTSSEYLRKLRDTDTVVNYIDGYYQIHYQAPKFVDEVTFKPDGVSIDTRKAVAVAGNTADAESFIARMKKSDPSKDYVSRANDRGMSRDSDDWFDVTSAAGRIAQKHRGKLLEDAVGLNHLGEGSYIANPVESAVRAARSVSGRTVMRPMLESAKARFIQQYARVLKDNGYGGKAFPHNKGDIGAKGEQFTKLTSDARTTWEYIRYLENGYINSVDEVFRGAFNLMANQLGSRGYSSLEEFALAVANADTSLTGAAKGAVFTSYIGLNPIRNWFTQPHQIARTLAYNSAGWLDTKEGMKHLIGGYFGVKLETLTADRTAIQAFNGFLKKTVGIDVDAKMAPTPKQAAFVNFMDTSGLLDAIDKQNLVRGSLLEAAGTAAGIGGKFGKVLEGSRKVGFDLGEAMNLIGHGAAVFDKRIRDGKGVSSVRDLREMHSELRAISYEMNAAGDMVYNQTSPALMFQFAQVAHKGWLQATNRRIPARVRNQMLIGDVLLFGPPTKLAAAIIAAGVSANMMSDTVAEWITDGALGSTYNAIWSGITGEDQNVDYKSLNPRAVDGWAKLMETILTADGGGFVQAIANSPSGQFFLKDAGKIQNAIASISRFFNPFDDVDATPETAWATAVEVMKISSGLSNIVKAHQAMTQGRKLDAMGVEINPGVSNHEALMQIAGFPTKWETQMYELQMHAAAKTKEHYQGVKEVVREIARYYQTQIGAGITDPKQLQAVSGALMNAYKDDPVALEIARKEVAMMYKGKEAQLMEKLLGLVEIPSSYDTIAKIKSSELPEETKKIIIELMEDYAEKTSQIREKE